jgi:VanZ family protein
MEQRTGAPGQLEHAVAYLGTAAFMKLGWPMNRTRWMGLGLAILAGGLELGQLLVPGRTSQFIDFGASAAGAFIGLLLTHGALHRFRNVRGIEAEGDSGNANVAEPIRHPGRFKAEL